MQLDDIQLNVYYYMIYNNNPAEWFVVLFYTHDSFGFYGKCINAYSSELCKYGITLNDINIVNITTYVEIPDPNTIHETHPHLFI